VCVSLEGDSASSVTASALHPTSLQLAVYYSVATPAVVLRSNEHELALLGAIQDAGAGDRREQRDVYAVLLASHNRLHDHACTYTALEIRSHSSHGHGSEAYRDVKRLSIENKRHNRIESVATTANTIHKTVHPAFST
jgi:hypothetical protein